MTDAATDPDRSMKSEELVFGRMDVGTVRRHSTGWWGMATLIVTEAFLFAYLLFSYYYMALHYGRDWLPAELPSFHLSGPNTALLLLSSVAVWWGERGIKRGSRGVALIGLLLGIVMGAVFVGVQVVEWMEKPYSYDTSSYGSLYFVITGFHMAHVVVGLLLLAPVTLWSALGYFNPERHTPVAIAAIYWHFVDVVWLAVFFTFYITPYLGI